MSKSSLEGCVAFIDMQIEHLESQIGLLKAARATLQPIEVEEEAKMAPPNWQANLHQVLNSRPDTWFTAKELANLIGHPNSRVLAMWMCRQPNAFASRIRGSVVKEYQLAKLRLAQ